MVQILLEWMGIKHLFHTLEREAFEITTVTMSPARNS